MLKQLRKYQAINVLSYFLENPNLEIHIKELARKLKISPATSKRFCDLLSKEKILIFEKKGNSIFFKLDNENSYVKELKRIFSLTHIRENWKNVFMDGIVSIAVYGSFSSGDYSEDSDLDILIISRKKNLDSSFILDFQKKIKKEVNLAKMTYIEWEKLKNQEDNFVQEILKNHFVIQGDKL